MLQPYLKSQFLLLESDLIFERRALDILLSVDADDAILASGWTHSGDEVYIEVDDEGMLVGMSKRPEELSRLDGELVGMSKISVSTLSMMCEYEISNRPHQPKMDYEQAFVGVARRASIPVEKVEDLAWAEIDDPSHLDRAKSSVYPTILERDANS